MPWRRQQCTQGVGGKVEAAPAPCVCGRARASVAASQQCCAAAGLAGRAPCANGRRQCRGPEDRFHSSVQLLWILRANDGGGGAAKVGSRRDGRRSRRRCRFDAKVVPLLLSCVL
eukprot:110545-Pleurochrysis_carterae.AAC.3